MQEECCIRDVFYIAGYDPRGYRHYYSIFKRNLALQNDILSYDYHLSKSQISADKYPFWEISTPKTKITYTFLSWNDIVKKNWSNKIKDALLDCLFVFKIYIITGFFIKFGKESFYQLITGLYPFFYVLFCVIFTLFCALGSFFYLTKHFHIIFGFVACALILVSLTQLAFRLGKKLAIFWIARICVFSAKWEGYRETLLKDRTSAFSEKIFQQLKKNQNAEHYELLLIAHSVGTILSVCVLAEVIKKCEAAGLDYTKLKILTLGECIPLVSFHKNAISFKKDLEFVAQKKIIWYDFTSIIDGACFPQVDFLKTSGIKAKFTPKYLSAKFHTLYQPREYKGIKRDKYKAHFLYLFATQIKGRYDFFDFVIGSAMLENKIK
ncbi:DUF829 domain-containing protein [Helicobacter turcicus]|uniref:DUF829 domain-containing protein n=1 Tax=Helicobacter turcicus TaxID=2867412 RepID=A0ABS7JM81_9HELI|nr:DUF829 domain-containing protein [Helicobacter turcicus]MBX7490503.1 DUF829 domain-containing protein [Helicobacter turcicus]MBX7545363.1 DUF829 domain-containing protein [Helicobacter turcicus]